jgi:hypothetical protein
MPMPFALLHEKFQLIALHAESLCVKHRVTCIKYKRWQALAQKRIVFALS